METTQNSTVSVNSDEIFSTLIEMIPGGRYIPALIKIGKMCAPYVQKGAIKLINLKKDKSIRALNRGISYLDASRYEEAIPCLKEALRLGSDEALYYLGVCSYAENNRDDTSDYFQRYLRSGAGNELTQGTAWMCMGTYYLQENDQKNAFRCFDEGSLLGFGPCSYKLGLCYERGVDREKDQDKANHYYNKAFEQGFRFTPGEDDQLISKIAKFYMTYYYEHQDTELGQQALQEIDKMYERVSSKEAYYIGEALARYMIGQDPVGKIKISVPKGIAFLERAIEGGEYGAAFLLGLIYEDRHNIYSFIGRNYKKAFDFYMIDAQKGEPNAQSSVASMYEDGRGVEKDITKAYEWYEKAYVGYISSDSEGMRKSGEDILQKIRRLAEDQGLAVAQNSLGNMYYYGRGVKKNYKEAVKYYRLAADQGDDSAQVSLGNICYYGYGVAQDYKEAVKYYRLAADQGNPSAQVRLGYLYEKGRGIAQDYKEAVKYYRLAADQGDDSAQVSLGNMYYYGRGIAQDYKEALKYYRLAAEQGHAGAQVNLGNMYCYGCGIAQDYKEAVKYYRLAVNQGNPSAQVSLGSMYYYGRGIAQDYKEAVKYYRLAVNQGNPSAQNLLGMMYERGNGVDQDYKEAVVYYRLAADQGNVQALYNLGLLYELGRGVERDYKEAVKYIKLAVDQGNASAQNNLGHLYFSGLGVDQDYEEAVKYYRLAAEQGHAGAQFNLAFSYEYGFGVDQDYEVAVKYYRLAAEQGNAYAQRNLGFMYQNGYGVAQNYEEAVKYYRLAADQGYEPAQYNLGIMYEYGRGVDQDYEEAKKYYQLAADQGDEDAQKRLESLNE